MRCALQQSRYVAAVIATSLLIVQSTYALSLSDFVPRVSTLSPSCQAIYTSSINGCQPSDFTPSGICSATCITALGALTQPVAAACPGIQGQNLIVDAINGTAATALCRNGVNVVPGVVSISSAASAGTIITNSPINTVDLTSTVSLIESSSAQVLVPIGTFTNLATSTPMTSLTTSTISSTISLTSTQVLLSGEITQTIQLGPSSLSTITSLDSALSTSLSTSTHNGQATAGGSGTPFDIPNSSSLLKDASIIELLCSLGAAVSFGLLLMAY